MELSITYLPIHELKPNPHNARTHSDQQVRQIANSMKEFGINSPILIDKHKTMIAGHCRVLAAKLLGIKNVPTICLEDLTDDQVRAYMLADNKLAQKAGWDESLLAAEFSHLLTVDLGFDVTVAGQKQHQQCDSVRNPQRKSCVGGE